MSRISNEQIIDIRNSVNIVDVISEYVPLVQRGKNYFGVCPFHDDHNPSMSVSPEKQIYTCFVCGATGNVFTFLMEYEHINFMESVKMIADKVGIPLNIDNNVKRNDDDKFKNLYDIYDLSNKFYQNNLNTKDGIDAKEYLKKRGFDEDIIKEFGVGLSLYNNKLYQLLKGHNYSDNDLLKSGICSSNENGMHDTFISRIMFPLWDLNGKVIGFSGRIYNKEDPSKYINSKESDIFKKGKLLYNYHRAKEEIRKSKNVIIVEGFMDVIALYKVGIKNVIATMGTAITSEQAQLIKKLSPNIILCFDGDEAGNKATISCSEELMKLSIIPKIIRLEENLDPDEYIKEKGIDKFLYYVNNPLSYVDYKLLILKNNKNFNNSEDISQYVKSVIKELELINDNVISEIVLKKVSNETGVSINSLMNMLVKNNVNDKKEQKEMPKKIILRQNKYEKAEQRLLFHMLRHKEVIKIYENNNCYMPSSTYRYLVNEIEDFYSKYNDINIADLIAYLGDKKELVDAVGKITLLDLPETYSVDEINDYINVLNQYTIEMEIERLSNLFKKEDNPLSKAEIAKQIMELRRRSDINNE